MEVAPLNPDNWLSTEISIYARQDTLAPCAYVATLGEKGDLKRKQDSYKVWVIKKGVIIQNINGRNTKIICICT